VSSAIINVDQDVDEPWYVWVTPIVHNSHAHRFPHSCLSLGRWK
jgi:hypothetical protein